MKLNINKYFLPQVGTKEMDAWGMVAFWVIDEVGMMDAPSLYRVHRHLQNLMGNFKDPFGGLNVLAAGDFGQLLPRAYSLHLDHNQIQHKKNPPSLGFPWKRLVSRRKKRL